MYEECLGIQQYNAYAPHLPLEKEHYSAFQSLRFQISYTVHYGVLVEQVRPEKSDETV